MRIAANIAAHGGTASLLVPSGASYEHGRGLLCRLGGECKIVTRASFAVR
jgi:hypothetical protein